MQDTDREILTSKTSSTELVAKEAIGIADREAEVESLLMPLPVQVPARIADERNYKFDRINYGLLFHV